MSTLNAGQRPNMVCDHAQAFLTKYAASKLVYYENPVKGTRLSYDNTTNLLQIYGKSAHGSTPQKGANALEAMLYFLSTFNEDCKKAYDLLFADVYGLQSLKDETGVLTISPNVASFANGVLKITTDIRFPATLDLKTVTDKLDESEIEYSIDNYQAPLFHDKKSELITSLIEVYNDVTGKKETPIAIGGGTYARALECGCAFGPEVNGEEDTIHQANEYVTFDRIKLMCDVYYAAIKKVCGPKAPLRLRAATIQKGYEPKAQAEPVAESQEKTEGVKILTLRIGTQLK